MMQGDYSLTEPLRFISAGNITPHIKLNCNCQNYIFPRTAAAPSANLHQRSAQTRPKRLLQQHLTIYKITQLYFRPVTELMTLPALWNICPNPHSQRTLVKRTRGQIFTAYKTIPNVIIPHSRNKGRSGGSLVEPEFVPCHLSQSMF